MSPAPAFLRRVRDSDWPAILEIANASVAHIPEAGTQEEWHHNRRYFDPAYGAQQQFVAVDEESDAILGYGAIESSPEFRVFVVTLPESIPTVGELLYERALTLLGEAGAERVWFTEYATDSALLTFARSHGFRDARSFTLSDGAEAMTLVKPLTA